MQALRYTDGQLHLAETALPVRTGEALVRVTLAGICQTDVEIVRGYAGCSGTLGHEFVGVVADSPELAQIGCRVVGEINAGCGACEFCRAGDARHCRARNVLGIRGRDGAFAEYLSLPPQNLLRVPDHVPDAQAVFTEPLAAACEILEQVALTPAQRVAILGDGKLGQLIARVLATTGCDLTLIGKHAAKLELAAAAGVQTQMLAAVASDRIYDVIVEATGTAAGLALALDLVKPRGVVVLKSTFHGKVELDTARLVVDEITLLGSRCGRFERALHLLSEGRVNVAPLIAREFALADGVAALAEAHRPGVLKVLLRP